MGRSVVLQGAEIQTYISGKLFNTVQRIDYTIDYGEQEIYGIDSQFAQEIAPTRLSVQGNITGIRIKLSGGLQGYAARAKIAELLQSPYTSLRIKDRRSDTDLLWLPQMKVTNEKMSMQAKGIVRLSFSFKGIVPYNNLDLNG